MMKLLASILVGMCFLGTVSMEFSDNIDHCPSQVAIDTSSLPTEGGHYKQAKMLCGRRPALASDDSDRQRRYNDRQTSENLDKILGGSFATHGEFPWQVNIYNDYFHVCGGVIISEYWLLTAATCVRDLSIDSIKFVVGDHNMSSGDEGECSNNATQRVIVHELFNDETLDNNIALIKVERGFNKGVRWNNYVRPICLPTAKDQPPAAAEILFSGWGLDSQTGHEFSAILKKVSLPLIDQTVCTQNVYPPPTDHMFCAGGVNTDTDGCAGDTGGAGVHVDTGLYILTGIFVTGTGCPAPNLPLIFLNVTTYLPWITSTIANNSNDYDEAYIPARY